MKKWISNLVSVAVTVLLCASLAHATAWTNGAMPPVGGEDKSTTNYGSSSLGGYKSTGSVSVTAIGTPTAPTVSNIGTAGATSAVYACTGLDFNNNATIPSSTTTTTTGNATLSTTNYNDVYCPGKTGAVAFLIHKVDTAHVIGECYTQSGVGCHFHDNGGIWVAGSVDAAGAQFGGSISYTYTAPTNDQTASVSMKAPLVSTVAGLPTCNAASQGAGYIVADSSAVAAEGQTCAGSSTHSALAICLDGNTYKCF